VLHLVLWPVHPCISLVFTIYWNHPFCTLAHKFIQEKELVYFAIPCIVNCLLAGFGTVLIWYGQSQGRTGHRCNANWSQGPLHSSIQNVKKTGLLETFQSLIFYISIVAEAFWSQSASGLSQPKTATCPNTPRKPWCPYQMSFFVSKTIIFVKSIRKLMKNCMKNILKSCLRR
jgi:hypothetical protein